MTSYLEKFSLAGKTAVVTGGAGLIGKEVATALCQAGARIVLADIDVDTAQALTSDLTAMGLRAGYFELDITDIENLGQNMKNIADSLGPPDIWINCAYPRTQDWGVRVERISPESWRRNIDMHLNSYALSSKYAAEMMKKKGGVIVNFASIYGIVGPDFSVYDGTEMTMPMAYSSIKGGIISLGRYLASYFGEFNVRVNTICPGGVFDNQNDKFVSNYAKRTPLGRMAKSDEIASVALFLASDAAAYITGATIVVDGGWTAI